MNQKLEACIQAALAGGKAALDCAPSISKRKKDSHIHEGHAIVTDADFASQKAILDVIYEYEPNALVMTEEEVEDLRFKDRIISKDSLDKLPLLQSVGAYIVDEICGSSTHHTGHYEWGVSIGYVEGENLEHKAAAVSAPAIFGGNLFYSSFGKGAFRRIGREDEKVEIVEKELSDSYVIFGADCVLSIYPKHNKLMTEVADSVRTINMNGSCVVPLSFLAAGMADALVQPLQCPWDYAAGKLTVEEAGGIVQFYEMNSGGDCFPLEKLELKHYDPSKRNVGFIAGNKKIVPFIASKLFD